MVRLHAMVQAAAATSKASKVLWVSTVWPERSSSAAGVRTSDLVSSFLSREGTTVDFAATSTIDGRSRQHVDALEEMGARTHFVQPNREDEFVSMLDQVRPDVVVFDRYYVEEMFSWIVEKHVPDAMRVLDMQDVHSLRGWRELVLQEQVRDGMIDLDKILAAVPPATFEPCIRELASIYRSDLTFVCSPREYDLLTERLCIPSSLLAEAGFFSGGRRDGARNNFESRENMMMIGNFLHPPNKDSVIWACTELWPEIRSRLGEDARLDIYGAYGNEQALISKIGKPEKLGINLRGWAPALDIMSNYRLLFAPIRFGAGLKGKVVDAWEHGLPVVTSVVGSEGMHDGSSSDPWGGAGSATCAQQLIEDAVRLYTDTHAWNLAQSRAFDLLSTIYDRQRNLDHVHARIDALYAALPNHRASNYTGALLANTHHRATEYFSRWIELKNKTKT